MTQFTLCMSALTRPPAIHQHAQGVAAVAPGVWYYPPGAGEESPGSHGGRQIQPRDPRTRRPDWDKLGNISAQPPPLQTPNTPDFFPGPPPPLERPGESPCACPPSSGGLGPQALDRCKWCTHHWTSSSSALSACPDPAQHYPVRP